MSRQWSGGKGDARRPCRTHAEEHTLRYDFALGFITKEEYDQRYRELLAAGKITRDGRRIG
jgi:hypothetical protein